MTERRLLATTLVPGPVAYDVLLPDSYPTGNQTYPLLLCLHGGLGGQGLMRQIAPLMRAMWASGSLPEMVVAAPQAEHSFYLDYRDGSRKWETFLVTELLASLRTDYLVSRDRTLIAGISMGGMGALRLGLKYPEIFSAVVAWEPAIEPALAWADVKLEDRFWRSDDTLEARFGRPIDADYWAANNPATLAMTRAAAIRAAGVRIYLEAGTEDVYGLYRGAEFLHRVLYDQGVKHAYRCVLDADHIGPTIERRFRDGLAFLATTLCPDPSDPRLQQLRELVTVQKRRAGVSV